ncbi:MAG TPA: hypothetical protein VFL98_01360 [Candidatus Paceibacterota bacterium]|nr:hypothetical protein [Candidatus Paceibacterota bacterium]
MADVQNLGTIGQTRVATTDLLVEPQGKVTVDLSKAKETVITGAKQATAAVGEKKESIMPKTAAEWMKAIFGALVLLWLILGIRYWYGGTEYPPPLWVFGSAAHADPIQAGPVAIGEPVQGGVPIPQAGSNRCNWQAARAAIPAGAFNIRPDAARCAFRYSMRNPR